jgi:hypothetical protein
VFSPAAPLTLDPWYPHIPLYSIPLNCPFPIIFYGYILGLHSQAHEKNLRPGRPRPQHSTRNLGIVCDILTSLFYICNRIYHIHYVLHMFIQWSYILCIICSIYIYPYICRQCQPWIDKPKTVVELGGTI